MPEGQQGFSMDGTRKPTWDNEIFRHPLIRQLGDMMAEALGVRIMIVYPTPTGWGQTYGDTRAELLPVFCRLFQGSHEGAKQCRMCHILMAVAACSGGPEVQRCHAGGSVSVCSVAEGSSEATAILSSCTLPEPQAWNEAVMRAKNVGLDIEELHKAYLTLPRMNGQQRRLLQAFMQAMSLALQAVKRSRDLEARLRTLEQGHTVRTDLEQFLKRTEWAQVADRKMAAKPKKGCPPPLIHVVCELVRQRPELPLTVKELAAAARLTPNHFTSLFGRWMGQSFSDYLATERIESAKKLLADLTLNVNEIARLVGYDDPGYFARRFRQRTGVSPREWRERGPRRPAARKHAGK